MHFGLTSLVLHEKLQVPKILAIHVAGIAVKHKISREG